jgi:hypothetical protein
MYYTIVGNKAYASKQECAELLKQYGRPITCCTNAVDIVVSPKYREFKGIFWSTAEPFRLTTVDGTRDYDPVNYPYIVVQIPSGYLLNAEGKPDVYAWHEKKYDSMKKRMVPIGLSSEEKLFNLFELTSRVRYEYRLAFLRMFTTYPNVDFMWCQKPVEQISNAYVVTEDLKKHLPYFASSHEKELLEGTTDLYLANELCLGDLLVPASSNGALYHRVAMSVRLLTHTVATEDDFVPERPVFVVPEEFQYRINPRLQTLFNLSSS